MVLCKFGDEDGDYVGRGSFGLRRWLFNFYKS